MNSLFYNLSDKLGKICSGCTYEEACFRLYSNFHNNIIRFKNINIMKFPKLYKKTATGATQTWEIEVINNKFRTYSGQADGIITISEWTYCTGKNIGKKNETSPDQQAYKEAEAKWTKKQEREAYVKNIDDINELVYHKPMLAHIYSDYKDKLNFEDGVWINIKYNGVRCIATKKGLFSRKGKEIKSCPHINKSLEKIFEEYPNLILDGELFNDDLKQNLGELISLVAKKEPDPKAKDIVQYWIYDIIDISKDYNERYSFIKKIIKENKIIKKCPRIQVSDYLSIDKHLAEAEKNGQEGIMVRTNGVYQCKRSKHLLKYKSFLDEEFKIINIEEGKGNLAGMAGTIILLAKNGESFGASPTGSHESWSSILANKQNLIGKMATVKYKELTPITERGGGVPSFAKVISIRDYE